MVFKSALYSAISTTTLLLASSACAGEAKVDFARDIRPLLARTCLECHGPDADKREGELRLDIRKEAFADRKGSAALVAGNLAKSEAWQRIISDDPDERMPPADSGKELMPEEIALVRRWIEQGASWDLHWAFTPPAQAPLPTVKEKSWSDHPIDAFVLARLERESLKPSAPANKAALLRRLSLDLIGLPPTLAQIDTFLADRSPDAYLRQVDRLLASPHYGERWARPWLDAARYADSDGFEKDKPRQVWFYRDWVVNALNRDLPYDQFIVQQIAGDQLPNASQEQIVATGFLRNSMINEEGGVDPEQFRMEAMFDRMDAIGKAVLGLTIQCGQCHTHKYDPLTQTEYYRMFAYINDSHESQISVYTPSQQRQRDAILKKIQTIENQLKAKSPDWPQKMAAWRRATQNERLPKWQVVPLQFDSKTIGGQKFLPQEDGSYLAQGYAPTKFRPRIIVKTDLKNVTGIRLELLTDPNLPHLGPGRSIAGTAALTELEVEVATSEMPEKNVKVAIAEATADLNLPEQELSAAYYDKSKDRRVTGPIDFAIDGKAETAWGIDAGPGRRNQPRKAVFRFDKPIENPQGSTLSIYLTQKHGGWNSDDNQTHNIGRFRISLTSSPDIQADPLPQQIRSIVGISPDKLTPAQQQALFGYWRTTVDQWKQENDQIETLWKQHPEGTSQLVLLEREKPRKTMRLQRGEFLKPLEEVTPGVPDFLHALPRDAPPTRLTFARWLADRGSPTTARAIVNRIWQAYFGIGLVKTSDDLGTQGELPSHPELLDWLSVQLMNEGWSLKKLHRRIVTSATYRQSSHVTPKLLTRDPENRLLARGPRFRVEAEVVRDIALAASGLLNRTIGGPQVYPPAPEFLFLPPASYGPKTWKHDATPDRYRRALYTFRFRSVPYPALETFDAPNGDGSCVRRSRSNTPLQALTTLNEPLFVECAQALALHTVREGGKSDQQRLDYAFRRCLARSPNDQESALLLGLLGKQHARYRDGKQDPWELATSNPQHPPKLPEGITPAQLAAWTAVSRVLLNLDETITKE